MALKSNPQLICEDKIDQKTKKHLLVCSVNVRRQAGKHITEPIKLFMQGKYLQDRSSLHKALDILGVVTLIATLAALVYFVWPHKTPDFILIDASIAPQEVITGDLSTLTFRYENNSDEVIKNARLTFTLPEHFELASVESSDAQEVSTLTFDLGDIAPTAYGFIHVRGTMFGDVGGEQIVTTTLSYTYSDENIADTKIKDHIFKPVRSALALELALPEHLVAYQAIEGEIRYTNTGSVTFPELIIAPQWPETFTLSTSSPTIQSNNTFRVRAIEPGEIGVISFSGRLGSETDSTFSFLPSFSFDTASYQQTTLVDTVEILPTPLQLSHAVTESSVVPGSNITIELNYENVSDFALSDVQLCISSNLDLLSSTGITGGSYQNGSFCFSDIIDVIEPHDRGTLDMRIPIKTSLSRSATNVYESLNLTTTPRARFTFSPDDQPVTVNTVGSPFSLAVTSPIILSSFGRYWGPSGDQLGRGPIPPIVGETTKYWIFWNISGTTNELANLSLSAELGPNVELTGRTSSSVGDAITSHNGTVTWFIGSLNPTLPPESSVVGIAFEVAITPTEDQIGTTPTLLESTRATGTDMRTQEYISAGTSGVTTSIPYDTKAASYGGIVEE